MTTIKSIPKEEENQEVQKAECRTIATLAGFTFPSTESRQHLGTSYTRWSRTVLGPSISQRRRMHWNANIGPYVTRGYRPYPLRLHKSLIWRQAQAKNGNADD